MTYKHIGSFEQESSKLIVTDPYEEHTKGGLNFNKVLDKVKKGTWDCYIKIENTRVVSLYCVNRDSGIDMNTNWNLPFEEPKLFGVDVGQAGVYDFKYYKGGYETKLKLNGSEKFKLFKHGCVCSSGYGDGIYPIYASRDDQGEVVLVALLFIV